MGRQGRKGPPPRGGGRGQRPRRRGGAEAAGGRRPQQAATARRPRSTGDPRSAPPGRDAATFASLLERRLDAAEAAAARPVEPLAHLDYERELALKGEALLAFWRDHGLAGRPQPVVPSPRPRQYRTTTRRQACVGARGLSLAFAQDAVAGRWPATGQPPAGVDPVPVSRLEPPEHTAIYRFIAEDLSSPPARIAAAHLNHVIVRGSYEAFSVILNLDRLDAGIVRVLKVLAQRLPEVDRRILSAFVFHDPSRSEYYFERDAPPVPVRLKRLYGPARLPVRLGGRRYDLPPTSFSQVNESMVGPMLDRVRDLLEPGAGDRLIDLFCGYGLFARALADACDRVLGIDADPEAIGSAADGARHDGVAARVRFVRSQVTVPALRRILPAPEGRELVILDPPRQGVDPRIIPCLAARRPRRVLHIFCGIDTIPAALACWAASHYRVAGCVPLDMFPGTPALETLVLLQPTQDAACVTAARAVRGTLDDAGADELSQVCTRIRSQWR